MRHSKAIALLCTALAACGTDGNTGNDGTDKTTDGGSPPEDRAAPAERGALRFDLNLAKELPTILYVWFRPEGRAFLAAEGSSPRELVLPVLETAFDRDGDGAIVFGRPTEPSRWDFGYVGFVSATFDELVLDARDDDGDGFADRGTLRYAGTRDMQDLDNAPPPRKSFAETSIGTVTGLPQLVLDPAAPVIHPLDRPWIRAAGPILVPEEPLLLQDGRATPGALEDPAFPSWRHRFLPAVSLAPGDWALQIPDLLDPVGRQIPGGTQHFVVRTLPQQPDMHFDSLPQDAYDDMTLIEAPDPRVREGSGAWWFGASGEVGFTFDSHDPLRFRARSEGCWNRASVLHVSVGSPSLRRDYCLELPLESSPDLGAGAPEMLVEVPLVDFGGETIDVKIAVEGESMRSAHGGSVCGAVLDGVTE